MIYVPDIDYIKKLFPRFEYLDDTKAEPDVSHAPVIKYSLVQTLIDGEALSVKQRLLTLGYVEPTEENKLPYINIKNYIAYKVASNFQFAYDIGETGTELFTAITTKAGEYETQFLQELSNLTQTLSTPSVITIDDVGLNP